MPHDPVPELLWDGSQVGRERQGEFRNAPVVSVHVRISSNWSNCSYHFMWCDDLFRFRLLLLLCAFYVQVDTVISHIGMNKVFCNLYKQHWLLPSENGHFHSICMMWSMSQQLQCVVRRFPIIADVYSCVNHSVCCWFAPGLPWYNSLYWLSSHEGCVVKIQTRKRLKRTLFIMTKHNMQTSGYAPF